MPKRNTYQNRGDFFWAKQTEDETPEEFWRRLIEIKKECNFNAIYRRIVDIKIHDRNHR